ncbi:MAG TPA: nucleotide exchange factor GrpE [Syntrophorhabdaceae bacterium]|nr:nucleotide exchange factor GrpE [Syntrophorhabdaceae bacterium]HNT68821.1 nucleotide exchange factor GrpE [Syntrophorhabdaceae bacterium]
MEEKEKRNTGEATAEKEEGQEIARHEEHKKKKKKDDGAEESKRALAEKDEIIKSLQEKILYLQAEFENYKKLKIKEKQDTLKFGNEVLMKELLPVLDNLEMALDHAAKTEDYKGIYDGVKITFNEFLKVLEKAGVTRIEAVGKKFDPNLHEAFYQEEKEDVEPDTVLSEFQKGYLLNNRLMRPSRVVVSKKPEIQ